MNIPLKFVEPFLKYGTNPGGSQDFRTRAARPEKHSSLFHGQEGAAVSHFFVCAAFCQERQ